MLANDCQAPRGRRSREARSEPARAASLPVMRHASLAAKHPRAVTTTVIDHTCSRDRVNTPRSHRLACSTPQHIGASSCSPRLSEVRLTITLVETSVNLEADPCFVGTLPSSRRPTRASMQLSCHFVPRRCLGTSGDGSRRLRLVIVCDILFAVSMRLAPWRPTFTRILNERFHPASALAGARTEAPGGGSGPRAPRPLGRRSSLPLARARR